MEDSYYEGKHFLTPMSEVIKDLKEKGVKLEFKLRDGALLDMEETRSYKPDDLRISDVYRFEGTTDPGKMDVLYVIEDKQKGEKGYISNAYGPYADTDVNDFIKAIEKSNNSKARKDISDNK
ncbi:hypothetical protein [Nafulsella turpanensis]|uniref:hypothetical protein n=1 Tax=Nafulsella turpanensis TaxID=1265690 RepID=UPI00034A7844|nr:hypothetical protein [Nafulsella turpanensis]